MMEDSKCRTQCPSATAPINYWSMARTPVTQHALKNTNLVAQGLLSMTDLWCKAWGLPGRLEFTRPGRSMPPNSKKTLVLICRSAMLRLQSQNMADRTHTIVLERKFAFRNCLSSSGHSRSKFPDCLGDTPTTKISRRIECPSLTYRKLRT
jgi:hypothetical protein